MKWFIYETLRWIGVITGYPFNWLFFSRKVYYETSNAKKKIKGGALIIANHFSPLDYVMNAFTFFPRKLYVVTSEHAFSKPFFRWGLQFFGGIEANRETKSIGFILQSVRQLRKNHLVMIFPEGHNTPDGAIQPFYPSYIVIAQKGKVPIVPIVSDGNYGFFKRVHMLVGEPIYLENLQVEEANGKDRVLALNQAVYERVVFLRKELELRMAKKQKKKGKNQ